MNEKKYKNIHCVSLEKNLYSWNKINYTVWVHYIYKKRRLCEQIRFDSEGIAEVYFNRLKSKIKLNKRLARLLNDTQ